MTSMEADEWLQLLAQHPIFDNTTAGRAASTARARMVVRDTDLFVAVGREVRWISLKACKDAYVRSESKRAGLRGGDDAGKSAEARLEAVPWYRLGCEALSFDISRLAVNMSGKLLAVVGTHQVAVVVLPAATGRPTGGAFKAARAETGEQSTGVWVDCRSMLLGENAPTRRHSEAAASSARTRVVDVLWHALSTRDAHLLVLQANGAVRMFDVTEDADVPEQTLSLFDSGFTMSRAVGFCMGGTAGWARMTLYVLTNTGELFSLCPVVPKRCSLDRAWLEDLLEAAKMDVREWVAEEYEASSYIYTPPELVAARAAVRWLDQLLELDSAGSADRMLLTLPTSLLQPAAVQGPYLFQPEPVSASGYCSDSSGADSDAGQDADCDPDDACDVLHMETGMGVSLVAIAYCDAHVEVFADLEPVIGRWADAPHTRNLPVLATLASADLTVQPLAGLTKAATQPGPVGLVADPLSPGVFYALHVHGVHRMDMRGWTRLLERAVGLSSDSGRSAALEQLLSALDDGQSAQAHNCVQCIVHTNESAARPAVPVVGAVVIDDIYLSYSLLALVAPCQLIGVSLSLAAENADEDEVSEAGDDALAEDGRRRLDLSPNAKDVVYVPRLPTNRYEVPPSLSGAAQQPRLVLRENSRGESGVSEERLKLLGSVVGQLRTQLSTVASAHAAMQERLDLQAQEHQRQHDKLAAISTGFSQHIEQMRRSQHRLDALRQTGQKLNLRVDQILRQLISHFQPELSLAEREFAHEVRVMDTRVNGVDGYCQLVDRLQERVGDMRALAKLVNARANARQAQVPMLSQPALEQIEQMLEDEQLRIKETCERINDINERVECAEELGGLA